MPIPRHFPDIAAMDFIISAVKFIAENIQCCGSVHPLA
jgi:hypothetical protein